MALQSGMSPSLRLKVATSYPRMLKMAAAAKKRGLDRTAAFDLELRYARMQLLSQDLSRTLKEESDRVSEAEIEDYYDKNSSLYVEATLARIFVPRANRSESIGRERSSDPDP